MKSKNYVFIVLFLAVSNIASAQEDIMCSELRSLIAIHNNSDLPTVNYNDDDTLSLVFPQQNITDIFSNYSISDFYQAFPNGSENLQKYYYLKHYSKALLVDITSNVDNTIISLDEEQTTQISQDLIDVLDGFTFYVIKHVTDTGNCTNEIGIIDCPYTNLPEDTDLSLTFTYNSDNDSFHVESNQLTPCGNFFSTNLKGGNPNGVDFNFSDYSLQTWENEIGTSAPITNSEPCYNIENLLFGIMGVSCDYDYNYGNIDISLDQNTGNIRFTRKMVLLGFTGVELSLSNTASIEDEAFQNIKPFEIKDNPYLQIANLNNQLVKIEMYNTSGQLIIQVKTFEENSINISNLYTGLYFIKLSNLNNQQKIFKFLKN